MKETKFKQTEVGMIPWDWEVKKVGDVAFNSTGLTYTPFDVKDFGTLVLRSSNIQNGQLCFEDNVFVDMEIPDRALAKDGDILVCVRNGSKALIGKSALVSLKGKKTAFGAFMTVLRAKKDICNIFLLYSWQSNLIQNQVQESLGATINQITNSDFQRYYIAIPSEEGEQQRIANALSDVDTLINNLEKLIAKKKNIKQGAMQQLLTGRKRLPGFGPSCHPERSTKCAVEGSSHFKMTELGPIPSDWEVKKLDDIMMLSGDSVLSSKFKRENYVGTENMLPEKAGVEKNISVDPTNRAKGFLKHDILISNIRPYLKKIWFADKNGCCSNDVLVIRVKDCAEISAEFCYSILSDDKFFSFVMENAVGTKMPRGDKKMIKEYLFVVPSSKAEQTAIANVLSDMDSEIQTLETKLAKYRKLKTGMMQQLLTGKIRLV